MTRLIKTLLVTGTVGLSLLAMGGGAARADIIPLLVAGSPTGSGPFTYTYDVMLTNDQRLVSGSFFTIYDFSEFTGTHSEPANWSFSSAPIGLTPATVIVPDSGALPNLTWTYTGPNTPAGPMDLGLFTADSKLNQTILGRFSGEGIKVDDKQP